MLYVIKSPWFSLNYQVTLYNRIYQVQPGKLIPMVTTFNCHRGHFSMQCFRCSEGDGDTNTINMLPPRRRKTRLQAEWWRGWHSMRAEGFPQSNIYLQILDTAFKFRSSHKITFCKLQKIRKYYQLGSAAMTAKFLTE